MVDVSAAVGVMSALKGMSDIAAAMIGLRDAEVFRAKALEMQAQVLAANAGVLRLQEENLALMQDLHRAEKRLAELEQWAAERERYALTEVGPLSFAYEVKDAVRGVEPQHLLCANCFHAGHKSVLQLKDRTVPGARLVCHRCSAEIEHDSRERDV